MEFARLRFAEPGRGISQCRYVRVFEAMSGCIIISPVATAGEESCIREKRLRFLRWRRRLEMAEM